MSHPHFTDESRTPKPKRSAAPRARDSARDHDQREWADFLCLWRLCDRTACRRAGCCRGPSRVCFPRYAPLLPPELKTWVAMFIEAKEEGLSYEEAMARIDDSPVGAALSDWHAAVAASRRTPPHCTTEQPSPDE